MIDAGLAKLLRWDPATRMTSLRDERISAASADQRRGRAGRTRPGWCYRLWPKEEVLAEATPAEMSRAPLEDVVLDACLLGAPSPAALLADAPSPPKPAAVAQAVENLLELQAIERVMGGAAGAPAGGWCGGVGGGGLGGNPNHAILLTPLGVHLGRLPLDPRVGKMLLLAALTGCLHPMLSAAASLAAPRSVFSAPRERQAEASAAQRAAWGALRSDPLAVAAAYDGWVAARRAGGGAAERAYCEQHHLNGRALRELERERRELARHLAASGFAAAEAPAPGAAAAVPAASAHASDVALMRGVICAALYPHLAKAERATAHGSHTSCVCGHSRRLGGARLRGSGGSAKRRPEGAHRLAGTRSWRSSTRAAARRRRGCIHPRSTRGPTEPSPACTSTSRR